MYPFVYVTFQFTLLLLYITWTGRPPKVKLTPHPTVTLEQKKRLTMECRLTGRPVPRIEWLKDGALLKGDNKTLLIETTKSVLWNYANYVK